MVNRSNSSINLPDISRRVQSQAVPTIRYDRSSGDGGDAFAQSFENISQTFAQVNNRINDRMDRMAADEARRQGTAQAAKGDVALRRDGTISGSAFDAAAERMMIARTDNDARIRAEGIYRENAHDPVSLKAKLEAYKKGVMGSDLPEDLRYQFELDFDRISNNLLTRSQGDVARVQLDQERAQSIQTMETRRKTLENLALRSNATLEDDEALTAEIKSYQDFLLMHGPKAGFEFDGINYPPSDKRSGAYSLSNIQKEMSDATALTQEMRVFGQFNQKPSLGEKRAFMAAFTEEYESGESDFSFDQVQRIRQKMSAAVRRDESVFSANLSQLSDQMNFAKKNLEEGYDVGSAQVEQFETQARLYGDVDALQEAVSVRELFNFQQEFKLRRPDEMRGWITQERESLSNISDVSDYQMDRIGLAEKLLSNTVKELKRDPLTYGARVGLYEIKPLELAGENAIVSMQARVQNALTVSSAYGVEPAFLTNEEVATIQNTYQQSDVDTRLSLLNQFGKGFGQHSYAVFNQISKQSPELGYAAGLMNVSPGAALSVRDAVIGQRAIEEGIKPYSENEDLHDVELKTYRNAFGYDTRTYNAALSTARNIYAAEAIRRGKTTPESFDRDLYESALQKAVGQWEDRNGTVYGGIVDYSPGRARNLVIVPPSVEVDTFEDTLDNLTDDDLMKASIGGGMPLDNKGREVPASAFQDYYLVNKGNGKYLLSRTDPEKEQIAPLAGSGPSGFYEFDILKLLEGQDE